jgi:hypothetical protein
MPAVYDYTESDSRQLKHEETGSIHTNKGATELVYLSMPSSAQVGINYTFVVTDAFEFQVHPTGSIILFDDTAVGNNNHIHSSTIGDSVTICADNDGNWMITAMRGTWVHEA